MDRTIKYDGVEGFIARLMDNYDVIAPVPREDRFVFDLLTEPSGAVMEYGTTLLPPVKWIYRNNEPLLKFDLEDIEKTKAVIDVRQQVLLFVHPCDINAINIMDEVLAEEPADENYLAIRRATVIIGYECLTPCREDTLCYDKGCHYADRGYDVIFTDIGSGFYVRVETGRGKEIVGGDPSFRKAVYDDRIALMLRRDEGGLRFGRAVAGEMGKLSHLLKENYDDDIWDVKGERCLSCGACNIVCPTCYCFDTVDEIGSDMREGCRYRRWDGCQLEGFCKVASGENFRDSAAARIRHRVFKKEVYLKKRFGRSGCVGCGRCIDSCMAGISIIDIFNHIMEKRHA